MKLNNTPRVVLLVFGAALAVRGTVLWRLSDHPESLLRADSVSYLAPAHTLADNGVFATDAGPELSRTPFYPAFLAAHLRLSDDPRFPAATQIVLDAGTAALVSLTALSLTASPAAGALGLLYALDPVAAVHAPLILSETLFTFLLTLCVLMLLRAGAQPQRPKLIAVAGLCLGAATMVRPLSYYLWIPWSLALAWAWKDRFKKLALVFALCAAVLPAGWCCRNLYLSGHYEFSTITGVNALIWEAAGVEAAVDKTDLATARQALAAEMERRHPGPFTDKFEESHARTRLALKYLAAHPAALLKFQTVTTAKTLLGSGLDEVAKVLSPGRPMPSEESIIYSVTGSGTFALMRQRPELWLPLVTTGLILALTYALGALGVWSLWRLKRRYEASVLLVPIAFQLALAGGGWSYYRFRLPMLPLIAVLAAVPWEGALKPKKRA
jgi:4-amino-4-deoxy-L-arabinose transferase-like glycosyltransferase